VWRGRKTACTATRQVHLAAHPQAHIDAVYCYDGTPLLILLIRRASLCSFSSGTLEMVVRVNLLHEVVVHVNIQIKVICIGVHVATVTTARARTLAAVI
jgi:hypothetical protein